ncbi:MAG: TIGR01906 family membrane protein [Chloroflexi bacterium]|nr:TIGR01906 family membrane protein [Chloroflexota bacterium]
MLILRYAATLLFFVAVPVFLVLTFVRIAAVEPAVHEFGFSRHDSVGRTGIDRAQLDGAAREIIRYFRNDDELLAIRVTVDGEEQALFTEREILHMKDVKALMALTFRVHEAAFVYVVGYVIAVLAWNRERPIDELARRLRVAGIVTVAVLGVAASAVVVGFDSLFRQFHLLSFANDFWQLDPRRDHLVQMYPQGFWFDVTLAVGLFAAACGALLWLAGFGYEWYAARTQPALAVGEAPVVDSDSGAEARG